MDNTVEDKLTQMDSKMTQLERGGSPGCKSIRSVCFVDPPPNMKEERKKIHSARTCSPESGFECSKSDWSLDPPPKMMGKRTHLERSGPPGSDCESLKSNWSVDPPPNMKKERRSGEICPEGSSVSCCESLKSDFSLDPPPNMAGESQLPGGLSERLEPSIDSNPSQIQHIDLPSIFKVLEDNVQAFVKNEIKAFEKLLYPDDQAETWEDRQRMKDTSVDGHEQNAKDGALKIVLHVLCVMNQKDLADLLEKCFTGELAMCQSKLKPNLKKKSQNLFEGIAKQGNPIPLNKIYTELYITEGGCGEVNCDHEVRQIESAARQRSREVQIRCEDIFNPPIQDKPIRNVLTKGIAGIGKTVCLQKFVLDWVEGIANANIDLLFPLPFRELNLMKDRQTSLLRLLQHFFVEVKESGIVDFSNYNVVLIFDGLDECRLPLDFHNNEICTDITELTSVDVLLTNLIRGNLLRSALIWITSRPAAAGKLPPDCVDLVTEVRGFTDSQKEEYFRKRVTDQALAVKIISHIKTSRSLHIMCHIPVFCWISATVLKKILTEAEICETKAKADVKSQLAIKTVALVNTAQCMKPVDDVQTGSMVKTSNDGMTGVTPKSLALVQAGERHKTMLNIRNGEMPKTLTQMYAHFLTYQMKNMDQKYHEQQDWDKVMLSLGKLAYHQLEIGNLIFYEKDLEDCGIAAEIALVKSGICTEIFVEEKGLCQDTMYCFVHLSIQEFLAAFYVLLVFLKDSVNVMAGNQQNQLDAPGEQTSVIVLHRSAVDKALRSENGHLDLFLRFLLGLSVDQRLLRGLLKQLISNIGPVDETIEYIKEKIRGNPSPERCINLFHCLNELNDQSLVEEIQGFLNSGLSDKNLSSAQWSALVFVLLSSGEELEVFDLKKYSRSEDGLLRLLPVVKASRVALLDACYISETGCAELASSLASNTSQLRELNLSDNDLQESGIENLSIGLKNPHCRLESLRLNRCSINGKYCEVLVSVLCCESSKLKELDLSDNDLLDFGVKLLCGGLAQTHCKLETLRLSFCGVTKEGCISLALAIKANPLCLKELDLSYNNPGEAGVKELSELLENPLNTLEKLRVDHDADCWLKSGLKNFFCQLTLDPNTVHTELTLSEDLKTVMKGDLQQYPYHPERFESCAMVLCEPGLSGRCYWEVEWSRHAGDLAAYVGVAYKSIPRKGGEFKSLLGRNEHSWSIRCANDNYMAWHNRKNTIIPVPAVYSNRLGLYLDWPAGILSFYSVSSHTLTHLHTFQTQFTEPVYAAFRLWADNSSVSLREPQQSTSV